MLARLLAPALLAIAAAANASESYSARGVYYFEGSVACPLAGIGSRAPNASNRLALDDDFSRVVVDRDRHQIVFTNTRSYRRKQIVGDLLLLGWGKTPFGERVPFGVHLKIEKKRGRFFSQIHPHPTTRDRVESAEFEPFTVLVDNGVSRTVALTPEKTRNAIEAPELTARLANIFVQVNDNLDGKVVDPRGREARLIDLSIGFGAEKLNLKLGRIELVSLAESNAPLIERGVVADMLRRGEWEMRITALSPMSKSEFERDLFLFDLDDVAVLAPLKKHGLARGESLVMGMRDGQGFVRLGDARASVRNTADVARSYLEFHFIGGVVARQITKLPQRMKAARTEH